jgi:hypothetical protein
MHPIPAASELQALIGREIAQIALDPHSVQFRWDEGGFIRSEFDIEHIDEEGISWRYDCTAHSGPPLKLHRLLQKKVESLEVDELCLTLLFEGGAKLRLFTEIGPYECGLIQLTEDAGYLVY